MNHKQLLYNTVSRCPLPHAYKRGVHPRQFRALTSLPAPNRWRTTSVSPLSQADQSVMMPGFTPDPPWDPIPNRPLMSNKFLHYSRWISGAMQVAQKAMQGGGKLLILETVFSALLTTKVNSLKQMRTLLYSFGESCSTSYVLFFLLLPVGVYQNHFDLCRFNLCMV